MSNLFGGGKQSAPVPAAAASNASKLFTPTQVSQITKNYGNQATAKWNQILSNMGAGGGTGGPDVPMAISKQATDLGSALGNLTTASGYGSEGMGNLDQILRGVEPGINPQYALY